jgi:ribosomal protein L12E/L44/L45/RPP1/RPP2
MAQQIIGAIKPILLAELEKNADIDDILKNIKNTISPVVKIVVDPIKLLPTTVFFDPEKELKEIIENIKKQIDGINLPNITEEKTTEVKTKLKKLIDDLIFPPSDVAKVEAATTGTAAAAETTGTATAAEAELEAATKAGLARLDVDEKNETIKKIMEMLEETGVLDEIKKRICTAAPAPPAPPAGAAAGGAKRKHRRKTKKNIRRNNNGKTRFGRTF